MATFPTAGDDVIHGTSTSELIEGLDGNDRLYGHEGADTLLGGAGDDLLDGGPGYDRMEGGAGDDTYIVDDFLEPVIEAPGAGHDRVETNVESYTLPDNVEDLVGTRSDGGQTLVGNAGDNALTGSAFDDHLRGGAGTDRFDGGADQGGAGAGLIGDRVSFDDPLATQGAVADLRTGIIANDGFGNHETMTGIESLGGGTAFADTFYGNDAANGLMGETGDRLYGFGGDDLIVLNAAPALADGGDGIDTLVLERDGAFLVPNADGTGPAEAAPEMPAGWSVDLGLGTVTDGYGHGGAVAGIENVVGTDYDDSIVGDDGANILDAGMGNDTVDAAGGDDVVHAGDGNDQVFGGAGSDALFGEAGDDYLRGQGGDDQLSGGDGNDILRGGAGVDSFDGGNDTGAGGGDRVSFFEAGATQGVVADLRTGIISNDGFGNHETMTNIESLGAGTAQVDTLYGNDHANMLLGETDDLLYGFGGDDVLSLSAAAAVADGGDGTDTLLLNASGTFLVPNPAGTGPAVQASPMTTGWTVDLAAGTVVDGYGHAGTVAHVENVTGSDLDDVIAGDAGDNVLDGGAGIDTVSYANAQSSVFVSLERLVPTDSGAGVDTLRNFENILGSGFNDSLAGDQGNNIIDGGAGADAMTGNGGNDTYIVDDKGDWVNERPDEGIDEVRTSLAAYTLGDNVENLTGIATAGGQALTGNSLANVIRGTVGDDRIDGAGGADTLYGYFGDDTYVVNDTATKIVEEQNAGTDTVETALGSFSLAGYANVENLTGTSDQGQALTGNDLDNRIVGGSGNDRLDGGLGADTLVGGAGDDTYVVHSASTLVLEDADGGFDTIETDRSLYVLPEGNIEALTFTGSGSFTGIGNAGDNVLTGGAGDDVLKGGGGFDTLVGGAGNDLLDGGTGLDTLVGGAGDDVYIVDATSIRVPVFAAGDGGIQAVDRVVEEAGGGIDEVRTSAFYYQLDDNVENLTGTSGSTDGQVLLGNGIDNVVHGAGFDDTLVGFAGNDTLDGGAGADTMYGGEGDDTYYIDNPGDVVIEVGGEGIDTVVTGLASYTLADEVEKLAGTADTGQSLHGNALDNAITGAAGNDLIDGGTGADTMAGGKGDDVYVVDDAGDVVVEQAGQGTDEVRTTLATYTLAANVETLTYTGTGDFHGIGSAGADTIRGGAGNDLLEGGDGNDLLDLSAGGADHASGGAGNDALYFGASFNAGDIADGGAGYDTLGLQGDYSGAAKLTIAAGMVTGVEVLSLMSGGGASSAYDLTWQDGNLADGQLMTVYGGNLRMSETMSFDGSAETHGYFVMYGGLGVDHLTGGAGNDGFYFGPGKFTQFDTVNGGGGSQNQLGLDGCYDFSAGSGLGTLGGNFTNIQTIVLYKGNPADTANPYPNVYHIETNDQAVAAGETLTIYGAPVVSSLVFDGSAETNGSFRILSGTGDDTIVGGHGDDLIFGNLGADMLTGGAGHDTFLYTEAGQSTGDSRDIVTDFGTGDLLDLSQIDADTTHAGDQAFTFVGANAFSGTAGELRASFDEATNLWTVEGDVNGDGHADLSILVACAPGHAIEYTDFAF